MGKGLTGLALLLAGALVWAYLLTHPFGEAPPAGLVRVWKVEPRDITRVTYQEGKTKVEMEPAWEKKDQPFLWIRTERERQPPRRPMGKPARKEQQPPAEPTMVKSDFKGNRRATEVLDDLAELLATRAIGGKETAQKPAFGLVKPKGTLRVELKGRTQPLELQLGALTYGKQMRYVVTGKEGQVFLLRQAVFNRLARAQTSLMDRELFPFPIEDAARISIVREGQEREFWRREDAERDDDMRWGASPDAAAGTPGMDALVADLRRLKALAYLSEPGGQEAESEVATLEVRAYPKGEGAEPAWVRFFPDGEKGTIARSSHTRSRVRISQRLARGVAAAAAHAMKSAAKAAEAPGEGG